MMNPCNDAKVLNSFAAWHTLYHAALFESDPYQLPRRIAEAENAILGRIKELFSSTADHIEEDIVLDDALYALRALRSCIPFRAASVRGLEQPTPAQVAGL